MRERMRAGVWALLLAGTLAGSAGILRANPGSEVGKKRTGPVGQGNETAKPAEPEIPLGWAEPRDGLQAGLFPTTNKQVYRYGDTLTFHLRVRNVSDKRLDISLQTPNYWPVTLAAGNRILLQPSPGETAPFSLLAGEEATLPNSEFSVKLMPPGTPPIPINQKGQLEGDIIPLLPGKYTLSCPSPIWIADPERANTSTGHRVKTGALQFALLDEPGAPRVAPGKFVGRQPGLARAGRPTIEWGEVVNGLQGGIAFPGDKRQAAPGGELHLAFYIRNVMDKPVSIAYPKFQEYDWHPIVTDAAGKTLYTRAVFISGWRGHSTHTLKPGEAILAGKTKLELLEKEPEDNKSYTPSVVVEPGKYTVYLVSSARFSEGDRLDMVLISPSAKFEVARP